MDPIREDTFTSEDRVAEVRESVPAIDGEHNQLSGDKGTKHLESPSNGEVS